MAKFSSCRWITLSASVTVPSAVKRYKSMPRRPAYYSGARDWGLIGWISSMSPIANCQRPYGLPNLRKQAAITPPWGSQISGSHGSPKVWTSGVPPALSVFSHAVSRGRPMTQNFPTARKNCRTGIRCRLASSSLASVRSGPIIGRIALEMAFGNTCCQLGRAKTVFGC